MSIVPISRLSSCELASLGNNVAPPIKSRRRRRHVQAVNRSLAAVDERVGRLYRRSLNAPEWARAAAVVQ